MPAPRRLTAELVVHGAALSGVVTDEEGRAEAFHGWLELIALLRLAGAPADAEAPDRAQGDA